jgi:hypothetical protein
VNHSLLTPTPVKTFIDSWPQADLELVLDVFWFQSRQVICHKGENQAKENKGRRQTVHSLHPS